MVNVSDKMHRPELYYRDLEDIKIVLLPLVDRTIDRIASQRFSDVAFEFDLVT